MPTASAPVRLADDTITRELASLDGWSRAGDCLARTFVFGDFVTAFSFMTGCALVAEKLDHHPEWSNIYGTVQVELTTHDAGGITALDVTLARAMDGHARRLGAITPG